MSFKSPTGKPSVLFVCIHNAGRSQMAAGWLSALAGDRIEVRSAGTAPAAQVNPVAVEAMKEAGIDITEAIPKVLTGAAVEVSDAVITMGCGTPARSTRAPATWTGRWTTRPVRASTPSGRSATRSRPRSRPSSPSCCPSRPRREQRPARGRRRAGRHWYSSTCTPQIHHKRMGKRSPARRRRKPVRPPDRIPPQASLTDRRQVSVADGSHARGPSFVSAVRNET